MILLLITSFNIYVAVNPNTSKNFDTAILIVSELMFLVPPIVFLVTGHLILKRLEKQFDQFF